MTAGGALPIAAVILAAGKGTRMHSARPKVLQQVAGKPLLAWVLRAAREAGCQRLFVVVGHGAEEVRQELDAEDITWVEQREQLGTGHALAQVERHLEEPALLLVLSGDELGKALVAGEERTEISIFDSIRHDEQQAGWVWSRAQLL